MKLKRKLKHFLVMVIVFVMTLSNLNGVGAVVHAAGEIPLSQQTKNMEVSYVINHSNGDQTVYPWRESELPKISYGDQLFFEMKWDFKDEDISTSDVFTYTLPDLVKVQDIINKEIKDNTDTVVGKFSIKDNVITVQYNNEEFCKRDEKNSYITFKGTIDQNKDGNQNPKDETITFPDAAELHVHLKPADIKSEIYVHKIVWRVEESLLPAGTPDSDKDYIYRTKIRFRSKGNNSSVVFDDEMWPGMTLYSAPEFYSDVDLHEEDKIAISNFEDVDYTIGGRTIHAVIPQMSNEEYIWVTYLVKIDPAMYSFDTANEFLATNDPKEYYPNRQYTGKVSNKASVVSKEDPKGSHSWGSVYTIGGELDKWANPSYHDIPNGTLNWEIILSSLKRTSYKTGYVIDILPEGLELVDDVRIVDGDTYADIQDGLVGKPEITKNANGTTEVKFVLGEATINHLKKSEESRAVIIYNTKVVSQKKAVETYRNTASIYYDNMTSPVNEVTASDKFINESVDKSHLYERTSAPNISFTIDVNTAAIDLDPDTDDLILEDNMSNVYSLIDETLLINGHKPTKEECDCDPGTGHMTFYLKDKTAYKITYDAKVMLKENSQLTENKDGVKGNSYNDVKLYAKTPGDYEYSISYSFNSQVFSSSAGASSTDKVALNVKKYSDEDHSLLLNGAKFKLTKMEGDFDNLSAGSDTYTETTGGDDGKGTLGVAAFKGLKRNVVYMLQETQAPDNYVLDDSPMFYAFEETAGTLPTTVKYNGTEYTLNVIGADRAFAEPNVYDKRKTADLTVAKSIVDQNDKAISSTAEFEVTIKDSKGNYIDSNGDFTADERTAAYKKVSTSASCKFEKLPVGESFTVVEKAPAADSVTGYTYSSNDAATAGSVTIAESNNSVTITNKYTKNEEKGTLKLVKVLDNAPSTIDKSKITFTVTGPNSYSKTVSYADFAADGTYDLGDVPVGTYTVTETVADSEKSKVENGNIYTLTNTAAEMTAQVEVQDGDDKELKITNTYSSTPVVPDTETLTLQKAFVNAPTVDKSKITFTVTGPDNYSKTVSYADFAANGTYDLGKVTVGTYTVTESIDASEKSKEEQGYSYVLQNTDAQLTDSKELKKGEPATLLITNTYRKTLIDQKGNLTIKKVLSSAPTIDKSQITFEVTGPNSYSKTVSYADFDANGEYSLGEVSIGTYTVTETVADSEKTKEENGYTYTFLNTDAEMTASDEVKAGEPTTLTITNRYDQTAITPAQGNLVINKVFENAPTIDKSQITFEVIDPNGVSTIIAFSDFDADGKYYFNNVEPGTYTVIETVADSEKTKEENGYNYSFVTADADMTKQGVVEDSKTTELIFTNKYEATSVTPKTGELVIKKIFVNAPTIDKDNLTFTVTGPDGYSKTVKYSDFNDKGEYELGSVAVGTYTVTETIADSEKSKEESGYKYTFNPDDSTADLKDEDTVNAGETTVLSITNAYKSEEIKKDPETPQVSVTPDPSTPDPTTPTTPSETPSTPSAENTSKTNEQTPDNPGSSASANKESEKSSLVITDSDTKKTYNQTTDTKTATSKKTTDTNVKTGDSGRIMLVVAAVLAMISMAYIGLWLYIRRKRNK